MPIGTPKIKRPTADFANGSVVTCPRAAVMMRLLGGHTSGGVALSNDEFQAVKKLYGFVPEKPNKRPPKPTLKPVDEKGLDQYAIRRAKDEAERDHATAVKNWEAWKDPIEFMQAGADRNTFRHAESDGVRLLAWLAKFVPPGEDPLKTLIQLAIEAKWDVDPADVEWAETQDEDESDVAV